MVAVGRWNLKDGSGQEGHIHVSSGEGEEGKGIARVEHSKLGLRRLAFSEFPRARFSFCFVFSSFWICLIQRRVSCLPVVTSHSWLKRMHQDRYNCICWC